MSLCEVVVASLAAMNLDEVVTLINLFDSLELGVSMKWLCLTVSNWVSLPVTACPHPVQDCQTPPLHVHTQFKTVRLHHCMSTPSSRLSDTATACPHPVQDCQTPPLHVHTQFKTVTACPHPVQDCQTPPLHVHTQFKTVRLHHCMSTPSSGLSDTTTACPHPVQDCQTPPLHVHTQFRTVRHHHCMSTPSSRLSLHVHTQFRTVRHHHCMSMVFHLQLQTDRPARVSQPLTYWMERRSRVKDHLDLLLFLAQEKMWRLDSQASHKLMLTMIKSLVWVMYLSLFF